MPLTLADTFFVTLAIIEVLAVAVMIGVGASIMETAKRAQRTAEPAVREVKAVTTAAQQMAEHARVDGTATARRVKVVVDRVRRRVEHTKRVVKELKPRGEEAARALEVARDRGQEAVRTARSLTDIA